MSDELDAPDPGESGDAPVAGKHFFRDVELQPCSFERQAALQRLSDTSSAENDMLIVFVCLSSPEEVEKARGKEGVQAFRKKMFQWATGQRITISPTNAGREELARVANAIWAEITAVDYEVDPEDLDKRPNGSG